ncbi:hypothetical protein [Pseudomonas putida]|uniref:Uncharacterized protein n=1 Tax=Pseudomonas putida TaxID=303 RepID=A0A8I1ECL8_PSEPU|nr:hypothetical protein [Pseudomonas putida]MBI6882813.1 hypothetical protein [Pseudomonas putida]
MSTNLKILNDARHAAIEIKKAVASGSLKSSELRFKVDFLRDSIIELASKLEFGYVAELAEASKKLLDTYSPGTKSRTGKIPIDDVLYLISTFPCAPAGVEKYISTDFVVNSHIINSVIKSESQLNHNYISDNFHLISGLSKLGDIENWVKLCEVMLENNGTLDLTLRTFSNFNIELIKDNVGILGFISKAADEFKPSYFPIDYMGEKLNFENLLYNLEAAGAPGVSRNILGCGNGRFDQEFTLQRYIRDFGFVPSEVYRRDAARFSTSPHYDASKKHLALSFFAYELSTDEPLCRLDNTPRPSLLRTVLELDGFECPYGVIRLNPEKVTDFLDETLRMALKENKDDWSKVLREYKEIDKKILMTSRVYKTRTLESDLGI